MKKYKIYGTKDRKPSEREIRNRRLAYEVAAEGIVLLENNGVLPLKPQKIALYGTGARMTAKGGMGSGDVHERYSVNIEQGLQNAGFEIVHPLWLDRFDEKYEADKAAWHKAVEEKIKGYSPIRTMQMFDVIHENPMPFPTAVEIHSEELTEETDTAVYVVTRQAGEGGDRKPDKGDYLLSDIETESIRTLSEHYKNVILILNCGSPLDLSVLNKVKIAAVVLLSQAGEEGGNALADILCGKVNPSGKLTATWAKDYRDYPGAMEYSVVSGVTDHADYKEGIYIGYRWFDANSITPRYPFGYGLSYTRFETVFEALTVNGTEVTVTVSVRNVGAYPGKEVVSLYLAMPKGRLDHEKRSLVAYTKTELLDVGSSVYITLTFDLCDSAAFDEENACFLLEAGEYGVLLGNTPVCALTLDRAAVTEQVRHILPRKSNFSDYRNTNYLSVPIGLPRMAVNADSIATIAHDYESGEPLKYKALLSSLTDNALISLCSGGGYPQRAYNNVHGAAGYTCTKLIKKGIPNIVLSDGPAGLNVLQSITLMSDGTQRYPEGLPSDWTWGWLRHFARFVKTKPGKGDTRYHFMTAFPCSTLRAQTWNVSLLERLGKAIGEEMLEIGVSVWLGPGMNLQRNPLCGRNFEYYSEDVCVSGRSSAAEVRGVESMGGVFACIKHFACNNQEDNRDHMTSNLSERALREAYLRNFRIAVRYGHPSTVMTSYNMINGIYTPNSYDLCTDVLRREWGYDGLVMSDWNATDKCSHPQAVKAGNDLIMPGNNRVRKALAGALKSGELTRAELELCGDRILNLIFSSDTAKEFRP